MRITKFGHSCVRVDDGNSVLVIDPGVWSEARDADTRLAAAVDEVVDAWTRTRRRVVGVSNEVGSGIVPATPSGRRFRDELGVLNARVAAASDRVWLVTAGLPQRLR